MSNENTSPDNSPRARRGSFTSNTFNSLFGRSGSVAAPATTPIVTQTGQRRMSIATIGLSATSPVQPTPFGFPGGRRSSVSTAGSDSIDENAIDDDDGRGRSVPTTPFARRMSFGAQALLAAKPAGSPGTSGRVPSHTKSSPLSSSSTPETNKKPLGSQASTQSKPRIKSDHVSTRSAEGLNWSEQFRSRAESAVTRPTFSTSPTSPAKLPTSHQRTKSFSEMPTKAPAPAPAPAPPPPIPQVLRRKPDAVGERMLRGDFHMD